VSDDALMRWEWEGGAPATVSDRDEAGHNEPGKNPPTQPRSPDGRPRGRRLTTVSPRPARGHDGDDGEG
jgi:hypothetical protein